LKEATDARGVSNAMCCSRGSRSSLRSTSLEDGTKSVPRATLDVSRSRPGGVGVADSEVDNLPWHTFDRLAFL